jgi:predicted nucleic-acid-binding Zn-ribbon protein
MDKNCAKCGSAKVIPLTNVMDQGQHSSGRLSALLGFTNPDAWVFKGPVFAKLSAKICGECGYTELFADSPKELFEAYQKAVPLKS